jgi:hypothetical protein
MPKITDKEYQMESFLIEKMDAATKRVMSRKLDGVFIIDGDEGFGKTGLSILLAYHLSHVTKRKFSLDNVFFDPKEFTNFINSTTKQIIIWDEAALGGLASSWASKVQQLLIQTLMTCRFRQHIIFFNCPKFYRLKDYFITDRALGLIHVYSPDKLNAGKVSYYKHDLLEAMNEQWKNYKQKPYKKFCRKRLRGNFIDAFNPKLFKDGCIIDEKDYDKKKTYYTEKLLSQYSDSRKDDKLLKFEYNITTIPNITRKELAKYIGVSENTITDWKKIPSKYPELFMNTT